MSIRYKHTHTPTTIHTYCGVVLLWGEILIMMNGCTNKHDTHMHAHTRAQAFTEHTKIDVGVEIQMHWNSPLLPLDLYDHF